jgi:hypothetical protein
LRYPFEQFGLIANLQAMAPILVHVGPAARAHARLGQRFGAYNDLESSLPFLRRCAKLQDAWMFAIEFA